MEEDDWMRQFQQVESELESITVSIRTHTTGAGGTKGGRVLLTRVAAAEENVAYLLDALRTAESNQDRHRM